MTSDTNPETNSLSQELTALGLFMEEQNADAIKAAKGMDTQELADAVAFLQDVRAKLGNVERDLTIALGQKMGKGTGALSDGRMFTVARSQDRKEWDHDDWKRDARREVVESVTDHIKVPEDLVDVRTGEVVALASILHEAVAMAQEVHGSTAPRSRALKALGLYASDYAVSVPSGWRFTAVKPHDTTTDDKKEA